ncbi:hypothetical protein [uncultured Amnibacterium sp.]|uniref:hypothetical protein n=1 Tax=uncultured Amnibacterium sp. TaxID=1631851 RepID=UPI0035CCA0E6
MRLKQVTIGLAVQVTDCAVGEPTDVALFRLGVSGSPTYSGAGADPITAPVKKSRMPAPSGSGSVP